MAAGIHKSLLIPPMRLYEDVCLLALLCYRPRAEQAFHSSGDEAAQSIA
jgi:hypothetical protein